ncbi:MAG: exodeoxyribonuclease III [Micrococcales bacterium]|nr:exodeoxyribonuclease III [Micrococcales bacterium]NBR55129.1 exodeoxyribonuclease III [Micrococcales bacterium]NBT48119.1 exodeoxyribonuclease III [Actinomycetota bacterium]NBY43631.1 exodeoxyribonuclease III [Micrococcales bacterium]
MRIATHNVNSIRTRVGRVVDWLQRADIDVLAMQEIKCKPDQFPMKQFNDAGYEVVLHGLNQWNGVAFASRMPAEDVEIGFAGMPGFGPELAQEARAIGATFNGVRLWSLYVPNGRTLEDPHYQYKLEWLDRLAAVTSEWIEDPTPLALMGDFNIAPLDTDVWDIDDFIGATHVSEPERQAFEAFEQIGLQDVVRPLVPEGYTYWDYQQLRFPKNEGMRIDFILGNETFAEAITSAEIVRDERKGEQPSDHVPVVVDLEI